MSREEIESYGLHFQDERFTRQFKDRGTPEDYGYFGFGANAIVSNLVKLPEWFNYLKYRAS
jgi:hypothetical protein